MVKKRVKKIVSKPIKLKIVSRAPIKKLKQERREILSLGANLQSRATATRRIESFSVRKDGRVAGGVSVKSGFVEQKGMDKRTERGKEILGQMEIQKEKEGLINKQLKEAKKEIRREQVKEVQKFAEKIVKRNLSKAESFSKKRAVSKRVLRKQPRATVDLRKQEVESVWDDAQRFFVN